MNSIKKYIFIISGLVLCSACQTISTENKQLDQLDIVNVKNEKDIIEVDSIETVLETHQKDAEETKNIDSSLKEKQPILEILNVDADDADVWLGDPFEDPDYIGTPCEEDENGNCIRHNHHKYDFHKDPEQALDSLN